MLIIFTDDIRLSPTGVTQFSWCFPRTATQKSASATLQSQLHEVVPETPFVPHSLPIIQQCVSLCCSSGRALQRKGRPVSAGFRRAHRRSTAYCLFPPAGSRFRFAGSSNSDSPQVARCPPTHLVPPLQANKNT